MNNLGHYIKTNFVICLENLRNIVIVGKCRIHVVRMWENRNL